MGLYKIGTQFDECRTLANYLCDITMQQQQCIEQTNWISYLQDVITLMLQQLQHKQCINYVYSVTSVAICRFLILAQYFNTSFWAKIDGDRKPRGLAEAVQSVSISESTYPLSVYVFSDTKCDSIPNNRKIQINIQILFSFSYFLLWLPTQKVISNIAISFGSVYCYNVVRQIK